MEKESPAAQWVKPPDDGDDRLRLTLEATGLASWETDFDRRESVWSANHFRLFGYPVDSSGQATFEMWSSLLHPQDHDYFRILRSKLRLGRGDRVPPTQAQD